MSSSEVPPFTGRNPLAADLHMPPFQYGEYDLFDADDNYDLSSKPIYDLPDGNNYIEGPVFLSSRTNGEETAPDHPPRLSHHGSSSSSSQGTVDSNSPKMSQSSADAMMTDDHFPAWNHDGDVGHVDSKYLFDTDPAIGEMSEMFNFDSASSSPGPSTSTTIPQPLLTTNFNTFKAPAAKRLKGHHKTQSRHSHTSSVNGVKTSGSREASPASAMAISQENSPVAMMNNPPTPENSAGSFNGSLANLNMTPVWPAALGLQANGSTSQVRADAMAVSAMPHVPPIYSPHATLAHNSRPRLVVHPTPLKSRVETQIPIKLTLHNLPPGIKRIHLPTHTISKPKLLAKPAVGRSPDMLELYTMLVCTSAMHDPEKRRRAFERAAAARHDVLNSAQPDEGLDDKDHKPQNGGEVRICGGCITRERKRAGRKKHKKPEEEELWNRYEHRRVIVFNTQEVKEWQAVTPLMADPTGAGLRDLSVPDGTVQVDAPMRIACYCRHHGEKMGFQVIFTMKDYRNNVVAQQISSSIMITDDHKTHLPTSTMSCSNTPIPPIGPLPANISNDMKPVEAPMAFQLSQTAQPDLQGLMQNGTFTFISGSVNSSHHQAVSVTATSPSLSRQGSPTSPIGPLSRKRKASGSSKVPSGLTMTKLETSQSPSSFSSGAPNDSTIVSGATSPFSPSMTTFPAGADTLFSIGQQPTMNNIGQHFSTRPPTPSSNPPEQLIFPPGTRNVNVDSIPVPRLFSAPASAHPSRAPSPNRLRHSLQNATHTTLSQTLYNAPTETSSSRAPQPMIYKIIPGEGPKSGGVEVTILGSGFTNGGLEVMFGEQRAATTTFWGETSLVCLLPPSPNAGVVPVSIRQPGVASQHPFSSNQQPLFRYVDDDEHRLIRTALTVLGHKLGGKITDVADIARNIIYGSGNSGSWGPSAAVNQAPNSSFNNLAQDLSDSAEKGLLRILELIDLDDSANKARINLRRSSGHTMLHLACSLGLVRFVAGLLSRGANVGVRDKGGFTPLHFAAMNDHPEIVRRLIMNGADPSMRSLSGLTPADVSRSRDVLRVLRRIENHSRSRSGGSVRDGFGSASSLRSLWDPPSMTAARRERFGRDGSTPNEDNRGNDDSSSEETDSDESNGDWSAMRRPSYPPTQHHAEAPPHQAADVDAPPATPSAAMTAIRDQFATQLHQWQQSMAIHFQNLPQLQMPQMQMPQMPALPPISMLPDYQAYLHTAPVMQRISSLVPNIRGPRPGSAGEQPPRETDSKWWDLAFFGTRESPPPAYEDIYPQKAFDTKQASAAAAAAEFEADSKCEALFDRQRTTSEASQSHEVPALLEIGRKRNITKEQQEQLQRAHAQRLKTGSSDKMLWFVWIPVLVFIICAMLASGAPSLVSSTAEFVRSASAFVTDPRELVQWLVPNAAGV
ncbi:hypothetical protein GGS23DRAFT_93637 [Durotheca rogersii]|uniref:uncharacterized protein n=1 Tax=Durotheca rogersii TaxID=419775 RepID=UPI00221FE79E|nr:uncharacterized protein GGS23DRAFT_93637 [Durotheca rogersii]KAI5862330.1 hypothetical protein GGS23DRAFT_93637 [Durotheca rogersii]